MPAEAPYKKYIMNAKYQLWGKLDGQWSCLRALESLRVQEADVSSS